MLNSIRRFPAPMPLCWRTIPPLTPSCSACLSLGPSLYPWRWRSALLRSANWKPYLPCRYFGSDLEGRSVRRLEAVTGPAADRADKAM